MFEQPWMEGGESGDRRFTSSYLAKSHRQSSSWGFAWGKVSRPATSKIIRSSRFVIYRNGDT